MPLPVPVPLPVTPSDRPNGPPGEPASPWQPRLAGDQLENCADKRGIRLPPFVHLRHSRASWPGCRRLLRLVALAWGSVGPGPGRSRLGGLGAWDIIDRVITWPPASACLSKVTRTARLGAGAAGSDRDRDRDRLPVPGCHWQWLFRTWNPAVPSRGFTPCQTLADSIVKNCIVLYKNCAISW